MVKLASWPDILEESFLCSPGTPEILLVPQGRHLSVRLLGPPSGAQEEKEVGRKKGEDRGRNTPGSNNNPASSPPLPFPLHTIGVAWDQHPLAYP